MNTEPQSLAERLDLDTLDKTVMVAIVVVGLAIIAVVLGGNNIGVQIESTSPSAESARADSTIRMRFFSDMDIASVEERFSIAPALEGSIRWNGQRELVFEPSEPLQSGQDYIVTVTSGAVSQDAAELNEPFSFNFSVRLPRLLYLHPASSQSRNLYLYNLNTGEERQLTDYDFGLADYAPSPDGSLIAYTRYKEDGTSDIWLHSLDDDSSAQLTNCVTSFCTAPAWHPNGTQLVYERDELDPLLGGISAKRIWMVDIPTAQSSLLFDDTQITGHSAHYSPTGNRLAMFSTNPPGVLIYDFVGGNRSFVENLQGLSGSFSPSGDQLLYPVLVRGAAGEQYYSQLELVDLQANQRSQLVPIEAAIEDTSGVWRPDNPNILAVTRRYFDSRYTDGPQIYLYDLETSEVEPLVIDEAYNHGALNWSPDGGLLAMQRFNRQTPGARPEIWTYNLDSEALEMIAEDAFLPSFIP